MTNLGLELALEQRDIPFQRTRVGDRYVHEALTSQGWILGGESSGHIICRDKSTTGDGIVAALEVIEVMLKTGKPLAELCEGMVMYPQHMINVPIGSANAKQLATHNLVASAVAEAESELGREGRVVLRASGTEPVFRVMIEGSDEAQVKLLTEQIASSVEQAISN